MTILVNHKWFVPALHMAEVFHYAIEEPGFLPDAVERYAAEGYYGGLEIGIVKDGAERRRIADAVRTAGLSLTQWLTRLITEERLNLSAIDPAKRRQAVRRIADYLESAAESGATQIAVVSGEDPGESLRAEAGERLADSLSELGEAVRRYEGMGLLIEPLDRGAHKNRLLGPTEEAVLLMERLGGVRGPVRLSWDTAHAALCGERLADSWRLAAPYTPQIHLANAVLDRRDPEYGDYHRPIGAPGFLDTHFACGLFRQAKAAGLLESGTLRVAVEVRTETGDPFAVERAGRALLESIRQSLEEEESAANEG